jgi:hypothetical protein
MRRLVPPLASRKRIGAPAIDRPSSYGQMVDDTAGVAKRARDRAADRLRCSARPVVATGSGWSARRTQLAPFPAFAGTRRQP